MFDINYCTKKSIFEVACSMDVQDGLSRFLLIHVSYYITMSLYFFRQINTVTISIAAYRSSTVSRAASNATELSSLSTMQISKIQPPNFKYSHPKPHSSVATRPSGYKKALLCTPVLLWKLKLYIGLNLFVFAFCSNLDYNWLI